MFSPLAWDSQKAVERVEPSCNKMDYVVATALQDCWIICMGTENQNHWVSLSNILWLRVWSAIDSGFAYSFTIHSVWWPLPQCFSLAAFVHVPLPPCLLDVRCASIMATKTACSSFYVLTTSKLPIWSQILFGQGHHARDAHDAVKLRLSVC